MPNPWLNEHKSTAAMNYFLNNTKPLRGRRGQDPIVVRFITICAISVITTKVVSSKSTNGEVDSIKHYVIKFVSNLRQVSGFLRFPPSIKLTVTI